MSKKTVELSAEETRNLLKRAYQKSLEDMCPSDTLREAALELSECGNDSCAVCAYNDPLEGCLPFYPADCMDEFEIDPCYEGVLKYLSKIRGFFPTENLELSNAKPSKNYDDIFECISEDDDDLFGSGDDIFEDDDPENRKLLGEVRDFVCANLQTINALTNLTIKVAGTYPKLTEATEYMVKTAETIRNITELWEDMER